ncbi:hypothetical protein ACAK56_003422, partial [Salmonella enterica]
VPNPVSFVGQFRKFRNTDIPEKGAAGRQATEIPLDEDEGIVERNFFVYYKKQQLLGWHNNSHASSAKQFAAFLQKLAGVKSINCLPLIQTDALRRLMRGDVTLKQIEFTIPRPTSPEMYPDDDYSQSLLQLMNNASADSLHLKMGINLRRGGGKGRLNNAFKTVLAELSELGATTARAQVFDNGIEHPIDLIADRIIAYKEVETGAKYPPANTMYKLIDSTRSEWEDEINGYLGSMREITA